MRERERESEREARDHFNYAPLKALAQNNCRVTVIPVKLQYKCPSQLLQFLTTATPPHKEVRAAVRHFFSIIIIITIHPPTC